MSADHGPQRLWGVFGGVGPLASLEFLDSIYQAAGSRRREQDLPAVLLLSDPRVPDRTKLLVRGSESALLNGLESGLDRLVGAGATSLVICCVTLHCLLPSLRHSLRARIVSLVDVALERVAQTNSRYLMLCSDGSRRAKLFEAHPLWHRVEQQITMPSPDDQRGIHKLIYLIKAGGRSGDENEFLRVLLGKYGTDSFIMGCTEMHILARRCPGWAVVDPLEIVAGMIAGGAGQRARLPKALVRPRVGSSRPPRGFRAPSPNGEYQ
jgi:aspartate racemase